jgi:hypothetical protein
MSPTRRDIKEEFDQELEKGWQRITAHLNGSIGWLIDFLQRDLDTLTPSEWMVVAYEVASFGEEASPHTYSMPTASLSGWSVQAIPHETVHYTLPSRKDAIGLQRTIRHHLEQLWEHGVAPVTFSDLTLIITGPGALTARHGSLLVATKPKTREFEYRVAVLLAQYAGRIRRCKECHRIFLAIRCDQLFCTTRCQMRVASRKWRKTSKRHTRKERR